MKNWFVFNLTRDFDCDAQRFNYFFTSIIKIYLPEELTGLIWGLTPTLNLTSTRKTRIHIQNKYLKDYDNTPQRLMTDLRFINEMSQTLKKSAF